MRKRFLILLLAATVVSTATAATGNGRSVDLHNIPQDRIDRAVERYNNQHSKDMPGIVTSLAGDERVVLNISTNSTPVVYGMIMDGMKIETLDNGPVDNPTLKIYTSAETLTAIAESEKPRKRGVQALRQNEIRYETVGLFRKIKYGLMTTAVKIFG
jgi:predicted metalloendopeptidase